MIDKEYIESGSWKCVKAPINPDIVLQIQQDTGAHRWVEVQIDGLHTGLFYCKYCFDAKEFPMDWSKMDTTK